MMPPTDAVPVDGDRGLRPEHLADLARSGLDASDAHAAGIVSLDAQGVSARVGFTVRSGGYLIPYPGTDAVRVRLETPHVGAEGKPAKYLSPLRAVIRLFVPPGIVDELKADRVRPLYITEGEKKALSMRKHLGVSVVGVAGIWAWKKDKERIPDLAELGALLDGRRVVIVFDSDAREKWQIAHAAHALAGWLRDEAGADARWAFPRGAGDAKVGIDDLIVSAGPNAARAIIEAPTEPEAPVPFVFRERLRRASAEPRGGFVGSRLFDDLVELLRHAPEAQRSALAEEARTALGLAAQDRGALLAAIPSTAAAPPPDDAQGQALTFADPEPWPDPVDGALMLDELERAFCRFVVFPSRRAATASAFWVVHTWAHTAADNSPLLHCTAPEKRCGKSRLLDVLGCLVRRPLRAANASTAALFRTIDMLEPTVLLDEADTYVADNEALRGLLNSAHTRSGARIIRTVGDDHAPRVFSTWAAIALAGIGELPDTARDRSIAIVLRRKTKDEHVERIRADRMLREFEPLRRRLCRWATDHADALHDADPDVPPALDDRAADSWRPLFAIADAVGGPWPDRARTAAVELSGADGDDAGGSIRERLLADVRAVFGDSDRLASVELVARLVSLEDRPWAEWAKGHPLTPSTLAKLLRPHGILPKSIRMGDRSTPKGYMREDFHDAWARYSADGAATPPQSSEHRASGPDPVRNTSPDVAANDPRESEADVGLWRGGGGRVGACGS